MHTSLRSAIVIVFTAALPGALLAQASTDAWIALMYTPPGALPPLATSTITGEVQSSLSLALRYGYLSAPTGGIAANAGAATLVAPAGLGRTVSLTAGAIGCKGCSGDFILGVGGDMRIGERAFDDGEDGTRIALNLNGELGYDRPHGSWFGNGTLLSGELGLPISLIAGDRTRNGVRFVPFVTPAIGIGSMRVEPGAQVVGLTPAGTPVLVDRPDAGWETGVRFMLGGGVGVYSPVSLIGVDLGVQLVPLGNSHPQVGLALTIGGR